MSIMPWRDDWLEWSPQQQREWIEELLPDGWLRMRQRVGAEFRGTSLCRNDGQKRALNLLRRHLNEDQWQCLDTRRCFYVTGKMRHYGRMREHCFQITPYGVFELKGGARRNFCIVAMEPGLPDADWMLAVKLLIESDLKKFFATAKTRGWQHMVPCNQFD